MSYDQVQEERGGLLLAAADPKASAERRGLAYLLLFSWLFLPALLLLWPLGGGVLLTLCALGFGIAKATSLARGARAEEVLPPSVAERGLRCPFCHEDFAAHEVVESCASCETVHHAACRSEFGACATLGCAAPERAGRRFVIAQDLIVGWAHPEAVEIEGEVATPFPHAFNYDPVTGLRRLGVEDYAG